MSDKNKWIYLRDIPYLGIGAPDLPAMDVWLPKKTGGSKQGAEKLPAVVLLHGGGWTTGDKADDREREMADVLCGMGYAVFSVNYHMAKYEDGPYQGRRLVCAWPECMSNCMDAVSYVRAHSGEFGVDPECICAVGSSAGGHLALLLATAFEEGLLSEERRYSDIPCTISGAVSLYGIPDIAAWGGELLMPLPYKETAQEWRKASPAEHMDCPHPPILLIHGDQDETVDLMHSVSYYRQLCGSGHMARLMIVREGKHSFDFSALTQSQMEEVADFLHGLCRKRNRQDLNAR